ncbi:MAG: 4-hydroxythreonine-4-phosphate dehydrogenase PdxA [Candidatus Omnitrophota bacterium]
MPISRLDNPRIAITIGDPAGIGPEIVVKSLLSNKITKKTDILMIGDLRIIHNANKRMGGKLKFEAVSRVNEQKTSSDKIKVLDLANIAPARVRVGFIDKYCGQASLDYVLQAVELARAGVIDAIVTAPISKEAINIAGFKYAGHTEILAEKLALPVKMMLVGSNLKVVLVTTHLPLSRVSKSINKNAILETLIITDKYLRKYFAVNKPRIGVCGLNPHAGEGGVLGWEEIKIISPAVIEAKKMKIDAAGPYPSDSLFYKAYRKEFDAVVSMYHDQGLVPLKMIAFSRGVNVSLGLPFVRTSPDHGTAFDIAGKYIASARSMSEAIKLAVRIVRRKKFNIRLRRDS